MTDELLKEIAHVLHSIKGDIPSVDFWDVENKLGKIVDLLEKQCELSDKIITRLEYIQDNLPETAYVSTSKIEDRLERIWDKLEDLNSNLDQISYNTST